MRLPLKEGQCVRATSACLLWEELRPGQLLLGDRGFFTWACWPSAKLAKSTPPFASAAPVVATSVAASA